MSSAADRAFLERVEERADGCWIWMGPRSRETAQFHHGGRTYTARRWSYERWVGPVPSGRLVMVDCGESWCVNPDHLYASTAGERFWRNVEKSDGCWEWTGTISVYGYGIFHVGKGRHTVPAHRYSLEIHEGVIPDGLLACHHCDNKRCVRPDHLYVGTHEDNAQDALERGQFPTGEAHGHSKLTDDQRVEVRARFEAGEKNGDLAREFGVSPTTITRVAGVGIYADGAA